MNVLLLAPQPFYVERGTPIAVRLAVTALVRAGYQVDLVCFHEGADVALDGLTVHRIQVPKFVRDVPIGLSWKKMVCDIAMMRAVWRRLRRKRYAVVHAVEESVFIAIAAKVAFDFQLIYDMDSLMSSQLAARSKLLRLIAPPLQAAERLAIRRADGVLAVCASLADTARRIRGDDRVHLLPDVALPLPAGVIDDLDDDGRAVDDLREGLAGGTLVVYVGNLEHYQGIELLLQSVAAMPAKARIGLAVIGGRSDDVARYRTVAAALGIGERVRFIGPRPLRSLPRLLEQADILCSPRLAGDNTPMKIYAYMAAGRAIVATDIVAHRQVLDTQCAQLVAPEPRALAAGLMALAANADQRAALGRCAQDKARTHYGFAAFERRLHGAYRELLRPMPAAMQRTPRVQP